MSRPFQVAALVASPLYPNSIAWSTENLIAVASGHLVTILNPEKPHSPRGVISLVAKDPFPLGTVDRQDLLSASLLPTCLARDRRPCVRSISWSPPGFASNYGSVQLDPKKRSLKEFVQFLRSTRFIFLADPHQSTLLFLWFSE